MHSQQHKQRFVTGHMLRCCLHTKVALEQCPVVVESVAIFESAVTFQHQEILRVT